LDRVWREAKSKMGRWEVKQKEGEEQKMREEGGRAGWSFHFDRFLLYMIDTMCL
jgi:hypothetical protein